LRLVFEYPIDALLSGVKGYVPRVYVGVSEVEIDRDYPVRLRLTRSAPPHERPEESVAALYMLLYPLTKPVVKLGSVSVLSSESAAMLWTQAPAYVRVVGVFHLRKTVDLEDLEKRAMDILKSSSYTSVFRFVARRGEDFNSRKIVEMWINRGSWGDIERLVNLLDSAANSLLWQMLNSIDYIDLIYTGTGFEASQRLVDLPQNFKTFRSLARVLRLRRRGVKGLFRVTPVGLCMFTPIEGVESNNQSIPYIDLCREFAYNTTFFLIHENVYEGAMG
jgi:hypothetical protein